jgi:hypothetical protein
VVATGLAGFPAGKNPGSPLPDEVEHLGSGGEMTESYFDP